MSVLRVGAMVLLGLMATPVTSTAGGRDMVASLARRSAGALVRRARAARTAGAARLARQARAARSALPMRDTIPTEAHVSGTVGATAVELDATQGAGPEKTAQVRGHVGATDVGVITAKLDGEDGAFALEGEGLALEGQLDVRGGSWRIAGQAHGHTIAWQGTAKVNLLTRSLRLQGDRIDLTAKLRGRGEISPVRGEAFGKAIALDVVQK